FNGTNTAIVFLDDVRAGDVIDYAYSVNGDNPVLAGRYADTYQLSEPSAVEYLHARLLWPSARKLYVHPRNTDLQPVVNQSGAALRAGRGALLRHRAWPLLAHAHATR